MRRLPQTSVFTGAARLERMEKMNDEFKEFNKIYKKKLEEVQKENKITDLFEQVDEALKRAREYEFYLKAYDWCTHVWFAAIKTSAKAASSGKEIKG